MEIVSLADRMGAAGLGLGVFSSTLDLLHACSKALQAWKELRDIEPNLELFRIRMMLQKEVLEHWRRDWYGFTIAGPASIRRHRLLEGHQETVNSTLRQVRELLDKMEPLRQVAAGEKPLTNVSRVNWLAGNKEEMETALRNMESILNALYKILPPSAPDFGLTQAILSEMDGPGHDEFLASVHDSIRDAMARTLTLRKLEITLAADLEQRVVKFFSTLPSPAADFERSRITQVKADPIAPASRSRAVLDEGTPHATPVIVEWKKYDPSWHGQLGIELRGRIDNIARLLRSEAKPDQLLTLHCLGYFDVPRDMRYGFAFAYPPGSGADVISLKETLINKAVEALPTLADRYQTAYALAMSLAILHTAGWLHKSIRSQNIIFPKSDDSVLWSRPYLVGFEYSRPDQPGAASEKPEESVRLNLYRHLRAQGEPRQTFRKGFDVYSLGIVLLEIGLWRDGWKLRAENMSAQQTHAAMMEHAKGRLAHCMGIEYRDVVIKCMSGELEDREHDITRAFFIEVVEVLGRLL